MSVSLGSILASFLHLYSEKRLSTNRMSAWSQGMTVTTELRLLCFPMFRIPHSHYSESSVHMQAGVGPWGWEKRVSPTGTQASRMGFGRFESPSPCCQGSLFGKNISKHTLIWAWFLFKTDNENLLTGSVRTHYSTPTSASVQNAWKQGV